MLTLEIHGIPIPQNRPRFNPLGKRVTVFDSQKKEKEQYQWQLRSQFRNEPFLMPISLSIVYFMPIPKNTSGIRKKEMIANIIRHIKKPDIDNLAKFTLDCMNGIVFKDDSQIYDLSVEKMYAEKPGTLIILHPYVYQKELKEKKHRVKESYAT